LRVEPTPGRTLRSCCFLLDDYSKLFSGETFLVRAIGRLDQADSKCSFLYSSIQNFLVNLPNDTMIFPSTPTDGMNWTSVDEEVKYNPLISLPETHFEDAISQKATSMQHGIAAVAEEEDDL